MRANGQDGDVSAYLSALYKAWLQPSAWGEGEGEGEGEGGGGGTPLWTAARAESISALLRG